MVTLEKPDTATLLSNLKAELERARQEQANLRARHDSECLSAGEASHITSKAYGAKSAEVLKLEAKVRAANARLQAEQQDKDAATAVALKDKRRKAHAAMVKSAGAVDECLAGLAAALRTAVADQQAYGVIAEPSLGAQSSIRSTNLAVFDLLKHHLRGVPGFEAPAVLWDRTNAAAWRYGARLPELDAASK